MDQDVALAMTPDIRTDQDVASAMTPDVLMSGVVGARHLLVAGSSAHYIMEGQPCL